MSPNSPDANDIDKRVRHRFEMKAKRPASWHEQAVELRRAAGLLWNRLEETVRKRQRQHHIVWAIGRIAMMLEGLAVENLAKAILVQKEPDRFVREGEWLLRGGRGHHLENLIARAGFRPTSPRQEDLISRLAAYVKWAGRYPIPDQYQKIVPTITETVYKMPPGTYFSTQDRELVDDLFQELERLLEGQMNKESPVR